MPDYQLLVRRQDDNFRAFAATLTDEDWAAPSLCRGWRNKDVLAHLALGLHISTTRLVLATARYRSFDIANDVLTRAYADEHTPAELIENFDDSRDHPRGVGRALPAPLMLGDHTVHHLDIALALGKSAGLDREVANAVLTVETTIPNPFIPAKARSRGLQLTTADSNWSHGPTIGPVVHGPAEALISALAGRRSGLDSLTGSGRADFGARLDRPSPC
jgi:uncharacterized protein (TIGR03083 family)